MVQGVDELVGLMSNRALSLQCRFLHPPLGAGRRRTGPRGGRGLRGRGCAAGAQGVAGEEGGAGWRAGRLLGRASNSVSNCYLPRT